MADARTMGNYNHGIMDNKTVIDYLIGPYAKKQDAAQTLDYAAFKQQQYDLLADHVRKHINMPLLYKIMSSND
jgi:adenosylcobyric acid synthase